MRRHTDLTSLTEADRGASAAIGNFDGVHLGHRATLDIARAHPGPLGVVTFEPHPREFFRPDAPPFRLMNPEARAHRLEKLGIEQLYEVPFDAELAALTPEAFTTEVLAKRLGLAHAVIGADFRFGRDRAGTAATLQALGAANGIDVTVAPLRQTGGVEVSSTRIRDALAEGRPRDAAAMLGHWHRIEGAVTRGARRGRDLGYPTANMSIAGLHLPRFGVYAVKGDILTGPDAGAFHGVASLGVRPMFGTNMPNLETHIFDFTADLYGEHLSVALIDWLRGEERFDSLNALVAQMHDDSARAREVLATA